MRPCTRKPVLPIVGMMLLVVRGLLAHPISLTAGQAVVAKDGIGVKVEVMVEDFMMFHGCAPNERDRLPLADIRAGIEKHKAFLLDGLKIRDINGTRLQGKVVQVEGADNMDPQGVAVDDLMTVSVVYHLEYPLASPPDVLTFQQMFGGDAPIPAVMELVVAREGLKLADTANLANDGSVETFDFDWDAAPETGKTVGELWRERFERRRRERMGITSYGAIYGFIYVQDHEVRVETLIPLATLETWMEVPRADGDFLEVAEQQAARGKLETFFRAMNTVKIDGIEVMPEVQRLDFYGLDFRDFAMRAKPRRLSAPTARIGVILTYSTKGAPKEVDIGWEYFNAAVHSARTAIYAYDRTISHKFSPYRPRYVWRNPGTPPLADIETTRAHDKRVDDDDAATIAGTLLKNVYRAFDYRTESDIYDALARSVHGDLLAELYLKIHRGLMMQEQGGAISRVQRVNVSQCTLQQRERGAFSVDVTWAVEGTVEHWGHIHTRENQYTATFTVGATDDAWKIVDMQVLKQKRLKYEVRVRAFK